MDRYFRIKNNLLFAAQKDEDIRLCMIPWDALNCWKSMCHR